MPAWGKKIYHKSLKPGGEYTGFIIFFCFGVCLKCSNIKSSFFFHSIFLFLFLVLLLMKLTVQPHSENH